MSRQAPWISRKYPLGDWGNAKYEDDHHFDDPEDAEINEGRTMTLLADALGEILIWLSDGNMKSKGYKDCVFRKTIALVWCMRPDLYENKSLREISRMGGVSMSPASLSKHVSHFTETFGRYHNGTKSDEAKKNYSKSATIAHRRKQSMEDKVSEGNKQGMGRDADLPNSGTSI